MSVSSRYSVTEGAIAKHASDLETTHQEMNTALNQFGTALAGLPKAWQGASYTSFSEVQTRWQNAATELNRALADIRERVATSATVYSSGEAEQAGSWRQVGQSVDWSAGSFRG